MPTRTDEQRTCYVSRETIFPRRYTDANLRHTVDLSVATGGTPAEGQQTRRYDGRPVTGVSYVVSVSDYVVTSLRIPSADRRASKSSLDHRYEMANSDDDRASLPALMMEAGRAYSEPGRGAAMTTL